MKGKLLAMLLFTVFGALQAQQAHTTYFDFNIDEANVPSSQKLSYFIKNNPDIEVVKVEAFADTIGHSAYNIDLSERRANFVLQQLRASNIPVAEDAEVLALGEAYSTSGAAKERKAVIYYRKKDRLLPAQPDGLSSKVREARVGDKLRLPNLNFYNYSDVVLPQSEKVLWELLDIMRAHPDLRIDIQGHICCQTAETDAISLKRAEAVYRFLLRGGISNERLSYQSFASTRPIYSLPEKNEAERMANRRVEIEILDKAQVADNM